MMGSIFRERQVSLLTENEKDAQTGVHEADTSLIMNGRCSEVAA